MHSRQCDILPYYPEKLLNYFHTQRELFSENTQHQSYRQYSIYSFKITEPWIFLYRTCLDKINMASEITWAKKTEEYSKNYKRK